MDNLILWETAPCLCDSCKESFLTRISNPDYHLTTKEEEILRTIWQSTKTMI